MLDFKATLQLRKSHRCLIGLHKWLPENAPLPLQLYPWNNNNKQSLNGRTSDHSGQEMPLTARMSICMTNTIFVTGIGNILCIFIFGLFESVIFVRKIILNLQKAWICIGTTQTTARRGACETIEFQAIRKRAIIKFIYSYCTSNSGHSRHRAQTAMALPPTSLKTLTRWPAA